VYRDKVPEDVALPSLKMMERLTVQRASERNKDRQDIKLNM
jgi:hypothetical protein